MPRLLHPQLHVPACASAQYILAKGDFTDPDNPRHAKMGFISSSDNHRARPGTGYKEVHRRRMADVGGPREEAWRDRIFGEPPEAVPESRTWTREELLEVPPFLLVHLERQASFFMTGGLVAAHSEGRGRRAIWDAMKRREVYGTSGPRMLLWFDQVDGAGKVAAPMGAEVEVREAPKFRVRAAGGFQQKPGCSDWTNRTLGAERVERLCAGECWHPGADAKRHRITRVEVVRIRPQQSPDEKVGELIEDPWKTLECPTGEGAGELCTVEFTDPDFVVDGAGAREVVYYVRAIQETTPAVNADHLRCVDDGKGGCSVVDPCYGDWRTPYEDDCTSPNEERAWSSPIRVRPGPAPEAAPEPAESPTPEPAPEPTTP